MNYANYTLQTKPLDASRSEGPLETPLNPEELPEVIYPSREEPGRFYAEEAERVEEEINDSDEETFSAELVQDGVDAAADNQNPMHIDGPLAAHSGDGLRH